MLWGAAAGLVLDQFPKHRALLELARAGYRGERVDQWAQHRDETSELVAMMLSLIKRSGPK
ncbi:DUF4111 domain-containing protein [Leucobacter sp. UT-8R-CII-1-4]|uniref:aminoglycoside adenylyltransferase domain-containing protein n=1 Tax=Leucobacter sp. UT-8R-CII-1-4 TaxID=3040075 RepID=UPI0024A883CB|nr:aminoglycoside adenylyltransferase domain-containing protein [Leucobacter sp. UT-8R-CII-1-4]MDI6022721.1 DUF4111 domain-containing protein [Leucobacter sp. UT-8R-CII-1-4]